MVFLPLHALSNPDPFHIVGATQDVGKQMIEVCHGNLDMAIGMHVDGEEAPGGGEGSRESAYSNISDAAEGASAEAGFE